MKTLTEAVKGLHLDAVGIAKKNRLDKEGTMKKMFNEGITFGKRQYKVQGEDYKTSTDKRVQGIYKLLNALDESYFCNTTSANRVEKVDLCKEDTDSSSDALLNFMVETGDFSITSSCPHIDHGGQLIAEGNKLEVCKCTPAATTCDTQVMDGGEGLSYKSIVAGETCDITCGFASS